MDRHELARRANALPTRFGGRLPGPGMRQITNAIHAGEWDVGLSNLIAGLTKLNVPVTADERDELAALLEDLEMPTEQLDSLNVHA